MEETKTVVHQTIPESSMENNHTTYASLFGDPDSNPLGSGNIKPLLTQYNYDFCDDANPLTKMKLLVAVVDNFKDQPIGGVATFTMKRGEPMLQILMGFHSYGKMIKNVFILKKTYIWSKWPFFDSFVVVVVGKSFKEDLL